MSPELANVVARMRKLLLRGFDSTALELVKELDELLAKESKGESGIVEGVKGQGWGQSPA